MNFSAYLAQVAEREHYNTEQDRTFIVVGYRPTKSNAWTAKRDCPPTDASRNGSGFSLGSACRGGARQIVRIEVLLNSPEARIVETVEGDPRILSRNGIAGGIHQRVDALLERSLLGL